MNLISLDYVDMQADLVGLIIASNVKMTLNIERVLISQDDSDTTKLDITKYFWIKEKEYINKQKNCLYISKDQINILSYLYGQNLEIYYSFCYGAQQDMKLKKYGVKVVRNLADVKNVCVDYFDYLIWQCEGKDKLEWILAEIYEKEYRNLDSRKNSMSWYQTLYDFVIKRIY